MAQIKLPTGELVKVDDQDLPGLSKMAWCRATPMPKALPGKFYAMAYLAGRTVYMHRLIMCAEKGQFIDHINGNGLDNRRENLRFCSRSQNHGNCKGHKQRASKYKGVYLNKSSGSIFSQIMKDHQNYYLGIHPTEEAAAKAYDAKAKEFWGEYAVTNF